MIRLSDEWEHVVLLVWLVLAMLSVSARYEDICGRLGLFHKYYMLISEFNSRGTGSCI